MRENGQLGSKRMNSHLGFFFPFFLKDMEPIALGYTGKFFFPFSNEDKPGNTTPHPLSLPTEKKKKNTVEKRHNVAMIFPSQDY